MNENAWTIMFQDGNRTSESHSTRNGYYKMKSYIEDTPWENALGYYTDLKWRKHALANNPERSFKKLEVWDETDNSYKGY